MIMKAKSTVAIISIALITITSLNLSKNSQGDNLSNLTLTNIEALANSESGDSEKIGCYQTIGYLGDDLKSYTHELTYCGTCTHIKAHYANESHYCTPK